MSVTQTGYIPVTGGRVWYRISGRGRDAVPLLALHGGPGSTHDYLLPLEELADERPVVFYDQLGSGKSDRPGCTSLWTLERFVEELGQVREALDLDEVHILGSSWGSMLATEYMLTEKPGGVQSLIFAGPALSAIRWGQDVRRLLKGISQRSQDVIREAEEAGDYESEDYQKAMDEFYKKHMCRLDPWPKYVTDSFDNMGADVYEYMWGPSEFTITGTLGDFDRVHRLEELSVPVLYVCGQYDEATPESTRHYHEHTPDSELVVIEDASHLQHAEQPEEFMPLVRQFLAKAEGRRD